MAAVPTRSSPSKPGRSVTYERVKDYWGQNLPINVGTDNWDTVRYDYYRDDTVSLEAFKAGAYDFRQENCAKSWATGYDIPAVNDGRLKLELINNEVPTGMQCFAFNTRRDIFKDRRVRQALAYAFDFEWTNKTLFYGQYTRTKSYFSNSELASSGLPTGDELEILEKYRGHVPDEVFTTEYEPPTTDGSGNIRDNLRKAVELLKQAGWVVKDRQLVKRDQRQDHGSSRSCSMTRCSSGSASPWSRISSGWASRRRSARSTWLSIRIASTTIDFDMIVETFGQSLSPGNEQRDFWGSESADTPGGRNKIGIKDPVIDELIDLVISAPDRESLIVRTHALDRVLLWGHYVIPKWHIQACRVAYWNKFSRPEKTAKYSLGFNTWWIDPAKDAALGRARRTDAMPPTACARDTWSGPRDTPSSLSFESPFGVRSTSGRATMS